MIRLESLVKTYTMDEINVQALKGVSFHIAKGEMVAIMGPSGCGKSTLMNVLGCLDTPTSGAYWLDGADVGKLSDSELADVRNKKIGFVFQKFNLLPRSSAVENVQLPLLYGDGGKGIRKRALESLEKVGLGARSGHRPNQLSGGEQQRVAIARALVNGPAIILADEPTGNLDSRTAGEIIGLLRQLNQADGMTIVLVTHDPEVAASTRRIISLRDGLVVNDRPAGDEKGQQ
ncbi:MAG: ABC transporter ATP-binding protein [Chloroflexi bacterium]|nr:ABC transporter ATP-binding protein [Chloroflexota bacterium]